MDPTQFSCPLPLSDYPQILMAHGGGGRLMNQLIEKLFLESFRNPYLEAMHDGAVIEMNVGAVREPPLQASSWAFTTDSYVIQPLFFPGGDIGSLAVQGTVNDLAMCGARPLYLSAAFILEEGLPMATLARVVASMKAAVDHAGVSIVTGDTKVVERGKGDGVFISMAGWGVVPEGVQVGPAQVQKGDAILLSGDVGRHGIAVMAAREGLSFETNLESDAADLSGLVMQMITAGLEIHCMRDLTRGGLASALNEIAKAAKLRILIEESSIPVCEPVRAACELLGLDPLYVANEGRFISFLPAEQVELAIEILHSSPLGEGACVIGQVGEDETPLVSLKTSLGVHRVLDLLSGEQLPRIC